MEQRRVLEYPVQGAVKIEEDNLDESVELAVLLNDADEPWEQLDKSVTDAIPAAPGRFDLSWI